MHKSNWRIDKQIYYTEVFLRLISRWLLLRRPKKFSGVTRLFDRPRAHSLPIPPFLTTFSPWIHQNTRVLYYPLRFLESTPLQSSWKQGSARDTARPSYSFISVSAILNTSDIVRREWKPTTSLVGRKVTSHPTSTSRACRPGLGNFLDDVIGSKSQTYITYRCVVSYERTYEW